jgi:hypothetical protein
MSKAVVKFPTTSFGAGWVNAAAAVGIPAGDDPPPLPPPSSSKPMQAPTFSNVTATSATMHWMPSPVKVELFQWYKGSQWPFRFETRPPNESSFPIKFGSTSGRTIAVQEVGKPETRSPFVPIVDGATPLPPPPPPPEELPTQTLAALAVIENDMLSMTATKKSLLKTQLNRLLGML